VPEWPNGLVLKTSVLHGTVGSNPTLSATPVGDLLASLPCCKIPRTSAGSRLAVLVLSVSEPSVLPGSVACFFHSPAGQLQFQPHREPSTVPNIKASNLEKSTS
jgi:hypothetical protein